MRFALKISQYLTESTVCVLFVCFLVFFFFPFFYYDSVVLFKLEFCIQFV